MKPESSELRQKVLDRIGMMFRQAQEPALTPLQASRRRGGDLDRRDFLAMSAGGLAAAMTTGCHSGSSDSWSFGKPLGDPLAGGVASKLVMGAELFQDTVYARPVVAPRAVNSHALVEGGRGRPRLQSDLLSTNPDEYDFLDTGYHFGPAELIQLEQDPTTGDWEVVHYHHPWNPRSDGARSDGLIRQVIMSKADGLSNPTKLVAVTGSYTNHFFPQQTNQVSSLSYAIYVEDDNAGYLLVGHGISHVPAPYDSLPIYPIRWVSGTINNFGLPKATEYKSADKYTSAAWVSPNDNTAPTYQPEQQVEHIVLYYENSIGIITLLDIGGADPGLAITHLPMPTTPTPVRLVHIDWDPTRAGMSYWRTPLNVILVNSQPQSDGSVIYELFQMNQSGNSSASGQSFFNHDPTVTYTKIGFANNWMTRSFHVPASALQSGALELDYSNIQDVHTLHSTWADGNFYHVKLVNFGDRGVCLLQIVKEGAPTVANNEVYLGGHFPLAFPDVAGLGNVTSLSGGTSKFSGFRYVVSDDEGNVFLMRQQRAVSVSTPYAPPIYAQNDAAGSPRTSWPATAEALPANTASNSNLYTLKDWFLVSSGLPPMAYNFLLDAALAFGSDDSNASQAVWLGNSYEVAYAPKRFALDSEHVTVKLAQSSGTVMQYVAYQVFKNPVDKTWRQRAIAAQIATQDLQGPGLQETGDHYQATVTPVNDAGQAVSLLGSGNENVLIEVRADSPCTVVDDTNNLYHSVDRYTSFLASPDPASGRLNLLVKADTFSQVLYVRLVDAGALQPASADAALLSASGGTTYPWQCLNLAAAAQQRMGNQASAAPSAAAPIADTSVYVSADTLAQSNAQTPWVTKGGYQPTTSNLDGLACYMNSSGQNLISATGTLTLGAAAAVDPLYAVTAYAADSSRQTVTTHFDYSGGNVSTTTSAPSMMLPGNNLGSIWSSISHALHDALHWLQNVESSFYSALKSDGVSIVSAVDSLTVTVAADIMKQVNGVEKELNEVVSTVEEYASVVANVIVTIVEHTFIYQFIKLLIALISLFIHLKDIKALEASLKSRFDDLFSGNNGQSIPLLSSSFSSATSANTYLGPTQGQSMSQAFGLSGNQTDQIPGEIVKAVLDAVLANPLTRKLQQKIMSALSQVLGAILPTPPINFSVDSSIGQTITNSFDQATTALENAIVNLSADAATTLVETLADSASDPQATFKTLAAGLQSITTEIETDLLIPVYDFIDSLVTQAPTIAKELVDQDPYVSVELVAIADLCSLLGLGKSSSSTQLTLSASEAIFFPMAMIAWLAIYEIEGKSISSVSDLEGSVGATGGALQGTSTTRWNIARLIIDGAMQELIAFSWITKVVTGGSSASSIAQVFIAASSWFNFARWTNEFLYLAQTWTKGQPSASVADWRLTAVFARLISGFIDVLVTSEGSTANEGTGWPTDPRVTDFTQVFNFLVTLISMGVDTAVVVLESNPTIEEIEAIAGQDFQRTQTVALTLYNVLQLKEYVEVFGVWIVAAPGGFGVQVAALKS